MSQSLIQRSFSGGEIAPVLHARADVAKVLNGLATCRNWQVRAEGGIENRNGFDFTQACKTNSATVRLMRYVSETPSQSLLIEHGVGYLRFFKGNLPLILAGVPGWSAITAYTPGDIVSVAGVNYYCFLAHTNHTPPDGTYWYAMPASGQLEIPSPYGGNGLPNWAQSGRIITLTHLLEQPRELVCVSQTRWVLQTLPTAPTISPPAISGGTAGAAGPLGYNYVVTAARVDSYEESVASAPFTIACTAPTPSTPNIINWPAVTAAVEYYVYCDPYGNGTFGFIGTSTGITSFRDTGFVPDFAVTPPITRTLFVNPGDYPSHSATYQQRRIFANTVSAPDTMWASRSGFRSNFGISSPLQDDDALTFRIAGNNSHPVRGMVSLRTGLVVLTDGGEWTVTGGGDSRNPLTPNNLNPLQETYIGAADLEAAPVGNGILYVQARARVLRELRFDFNVEGLAGKDVTAYASHLFVGYTIQRLVYQQVPHSIAWLVRSDGGLLGMTYVPAEDIIAWHRHDTWQNTEQGIVEDAVVVPEGDYDALYVIVKRMIAGSAVRYIERLRDRTIRPGYVTVDASFVDSGKSYSGVAINTMTGLGHLEGQVVAVVGDGRVLYNGDATGAAAGAWTVVGGSVALGGSFTNVKAGLRIQNADAELLTPDVQGSQVRDKLKRTPSITLMVDRSSRSFSAGPDVAHLVPFAAETYQGAALEFTGACELTMLSSYERSGRVFIRQTDPLPIAIIAAVPSVDIGG